MKKSTIWLLAVIMAITFCSLLYFQMTYLDKMVGMRNEQFSDNVRRSLNATADFLEKQETLYYLEQDVNSLEASLVNTTYGPPGPYDTNLKYSIVSPDGTVTNYTLSSEVDRSKRDPDKVRYPDKRRDIGSRYQTMHEVLRGQYLYQRGLLDEVILTILRDSGSRPLIERADSTVIKSFLSTELANNGLGELPFSFAITDCKEAILYSTRHYNPASRENTYEQALFPNSSAKYHLKVQFPTKHNYIYSSVKFIVPADTAGDIPVHHHHGVQAEKAHRDEVGLHQQHDPRAEDPHIDHLTGGADAQRRLGAQVARNAGKHVARHRR